jgi:uncharacterized protein YktB (UPF0637 family)
MAITGFEASMNAVQKAISSQLSALSSQLVDESCKHFLYLYHFARKPLEIKRLDHFQVTCQEQLVFQFTGGTHCDLAEPSKFSVTFSATSLCDIRAN